MSVKSDINISQMFNKYISVIDQYKDKILDATNAIGIIMVINAALIIALFISILHTGYVSNKKLKEDQEENKMSESEKKLRRLTYRQSFIVISIIVLYIVLIAIASRIRNKIINKLF